MLDHDATVEQQVACHYWCAHDADDVEFSGEIEQHHDGLLRCLQEHLLAEQVLTGITCDGQLWESDDLHAPALCLGYLVFYLLGIEDDIAHLDGRDGTRHLNKSVLHITLNFEI